MLIFQSELIPLSPISLHIRLLNCGQQDPWQGSSPLHSFKGGGCQGSLNPRGRRLASHPLPPPISLAPYLVPLGSEAEGPASVELLRRVSPAMAARPAPPRMMRRYPSSDMRTLWFINFKI